MRHMLLVVLAAALVIPAQSTAGAKELRKDHPRFYRPDHREAALDIPGHESRATEAAAAVDTYCIVWYDFEIMDWQGWTRVDNGMQPGTFFHVEDFTGLGGGTYGRLVPIEGTKSIWCGADGSNLDYSCSWDSAPGYGNGWIQSFRTRHFYHEGLITVSFHLVCDTEEGCDFVYFDHSDDYFLLPFETYGTFSGVVDTVVTYEFSARWARSKLRFRFESDASHSDADGFYDTDGACIIDSITIVDDSGILDFEDFESYESGDTSAGLWYAHRGNHPDGSPWEDSFGTFSGLTTNLMDKDPCGDNYSTVVMFFLGSSYPSAEYPGLLETPFCSGPGGIAEPCQNEMIVSPPIDLTRYTTGRDEDQDASIPPVDLGFLGGFGLEYAVYSDNPVSNLVFRTHLVRNIENGCGGDWIAPGILFPYEPKGWWTAFWDIGSIVTADTIQVALGVVDMCDAWYGTYGDCEYHTPAPWFDSVRIKRWDSQGPQWSVRAAELFQDTFPREVPDSPDPMEEFCRADMAIDLAPGEEYGRIDPGDSAVVQVAAPNSGGLDTLVTGEAMVYLHCNVEFLGLDGKPDLGGPQLAGTYGSYAGEEGDWTILLCEPAATSAGSFAPGRYCVDLNDSLFTRGYMIEYYFKAFDAEGNSTTYPENAGSGGNRYEFTCLPTLRSIPGALYVDDYHGRGTFNGEAQEYYDMAFASVLPGGLIPDRYDVNGPSSGVDNGIGAYTSVSDSSSVFCRAYDKVIFDSGDLSRVTISEGTNSSDKSNDAGLLVDWMNLSGHRVGLLIMGDNIASDLAGSIAPVALELAGTLCGVTAGNNSYFELTGGITAGGTTTPMITGVTGGPYDGFTCYTYGGCYNINDFDVLLPVGIGQNALRYPDYSSLQCYAGIFTDQISGANQPLRTVWAGFSFMFMREAEPYFFVHSDFLFRTCRFLETGATTTHSEIPAATSLADNFPNPFNPVTRLKFALKEKGPVSLRVYDVSGRLVRVLVDEVREAGSYEAVWDGTNDKGRGIASGIYFCRMEAGDYERSLEDGAAEMRELYIHAGREMKALVAAAILLSALSSAGFAGDPRDGCLDELIHFLQPEDHRLPRGRFREYPQRVRRRQRLYRGCHI